MNVATPVAPSRHLIVTSSVITLEKESVRFT